MLKERYSLGDVAVVIRVGRSEERLRHELWELLGLLAIGFVMAVGAAGLGGYLLARQALSPVGKVSRSHARQSRSMEATSSLRVKMGKELPFVSCFLWLKSDGMPNQGTPDREFRKMSGEEPVLAR